MIAPQAETILKEKFGYDHFRAGQNQAISRVLGCDANRRREIVVLSDSSDVVVGIDARGVAAHRVDEGSGGCAER